MLFSLKISTYIRSTFICQFFRREFTVRLIRRVISDATRCKVDIGLCVPATKYALMKYRLMIDDQEHLEKLKERSVNLKGD